MKTIAKVLLILAAIAFVLYALYCAQVWSIQRRMMFPGAAMNAVSDPAHWPPHAQSLSLDDAAIGARAIWVPASSDGPVSTVMFFHGNAEFAFKSVAELSALVGESRNLLLIEYPGYAGAPGAPSLESILAVSTLAYDWLLAQPTVDRKRIVALGRSIGGGPAAELSRHRPLAALILMSTFTSIEDMARGFYVPALLIRDPFDNRARVAQLNGPTLVMHGKRDNVIPYALGLALSKASPRTQFVTLSCAHNDCALDGIEIRNAVSAFLTAHAL